LITFRALYFFIKKLSFLISLKKFFLVIRRAHHILVQLPTIIKSKEDIKIVYYYLNKLFNCWFDYGEINEFVFNQELLQLLFGNARTPKRVYIHCCHINIMEHNMENSLQFVLNNLSSGNLHSSLRLYQDIIGKYKDILFKILTNGGNNFKEISFGFFNCSVNVVDSINVAILYEHIVEVSRSRKSLKINSKHFSIQQHPKTVQK